MAKKKRNPQDATRKHDVAPLRRRIEKLEREMKVLRERFEELLESVVPLLSYEGE